MFVKARKRFALAIAIVAIAGLSAGMSSAAETPQHGGTLTVGFSSDTKTLDPTFSIQWSERQVLYLIYNTLIRTGQGFTLNPELAKSWEVSDDGLRVVFKLQEGVKFHDGTDFDADAAKWNLDRRLDESVGSPQRKQLLPVIKSIEVVDKYTFAINLKEPFPPLLGFLAERSGFVISPTAAKKYGEDYGSNPVGTGPFVFREWVRGGHIILERNDDYWEEGLPYLDRVVFSDIAGAVVGIQWSGQPLTQFIEARTAAVDYLQMVREHFEDEELEHLDKAIAEYEKVVGLLKAVQRALPSLEARETAQEDATPKVRLGLGVSQIGLWMHPNREAQTPKEAMSHFKPKCRAAIKVLQRTVVAETKATREIRNVLQTSEKMKM